MIHHWEHSISADSNEQKYPEEIDKIIQQRFKNKFREEHWCSKHSNRFLAKVFQVTSVVFHN